MKKKKVKVPRNERVAVQAVKPTDPSLKAISKFRAEIIKMTTTPVTKLFDSKIKTTLQTARKIETSLRKFETPELASIQEREDDSMEHWLNTRGNTINATIDLEDYLCAIEEDENEKGIVQRKREKLLTSIFDVNENVTVRTEGK